jgi:hypothetical protein
MPNANRVDCGTTSEEVKGLASGLISKSQDTMSPGHYLSVPTFHRAGCCLRGIAAVARKLAETL